MKKIGTFYVGIGTFYVGIGTFYVGIGTFYVGKNFFEKARKALYINGFSDFSTRSKNPNR